MRPALPNRGGRAGAVPVRPEPVPFVPGGAVEPSEQRRPRGGFATRAVQGAVAPTPDQHPVSVPIHPSATWAVDRSREVADLLDDRLPGYVYGRYDNPTNTALHGVVASLHDAPAAWATASGTVAIHAALAHLRGDGRVLAADHLYGGTVALLRRLAVEAGWAVDTAPLLTAADLEAALTDAHSVVHVETVANPSAAIADLPALAAVCRARGVALVVDNTFASPVSCRPLTFGATAVVESATKALGGHGDVVAGVVAGGEDLVAGVRHHVIEYGGSLGPFEAWLVQRGIQTLHLRVRQACANATVVAAALADGGVPVSHPSRPGHPQHALVDTVLGGLPGATFAFDLPTREAAEAFADACEVFQRAVSLGGTHSLVLHPGSTTHRQLSDAELRAAGMGPGTVRLSVGIEEVDDLVADVRRGLAAAVGADPLR
ncbi:aminotransferase class I/II-fold pyridoxal phosphate-dependent enzyme [Nitriliruptoraceae bacterium ZYF776]|nr:aminotransferase class I/II-fold pyridoxal phosphate-dependent enzyme [Profundirhabdus halotolerans]